MASFKLPGPEPTQTLEGHEGAVLSLSLGCSAFCAEAMVCTWNAHSELGRAEVMDKEWSVHHDRLSGAQSNSREREIFSCECDDV